MSQRSKLLRSHARDPSPAQLISWPAESLGTKRYFRTTASDRIRAHERRRRTRSRVLRSTNSGLNPSATMRWPLRDRSQSPWLPSTTSRVRVQTREAAGSAVAPAFLPRCAGLQELPRANGPSLSSATCHPMFRPPNGGSESHTRLTLHLLSRVITNASGEGNSVRPTVFHCNTTDACRECCAKQHTAMRGIESDADVPVELASPQNGSISFGPRYRCARGECCFPP
jgi:hypothetical protein